MTELCNMYFEMGVNTSVFILFIIFTRLLLKNAPRKLYLFLWGLCGIRLLIPLPIESSYAFIPPVQQTTSTIVQHLPIDLSMNHASTIVPVTANNMKLHLFTILWIIGMLILLGYYLMTYLTLYHKTKQSIQYQDNIYLCDLIETPFVLGIIHPKVYIPSHLNEDYFKYIIDHEQVHIKQKDYIWKLFSVIILCIYWYHPLVWCFYLLLNKDIELACDEQVIRNYQKEDKKAYLNALLACSTSEKKVMCFSLGFSQSDIKERIQKLIHYRKPTTLMMILSLLLCISGCSFMTQQPNVLWYPKYEAIVSKYHQTNEVPDHIDILNNEKLYQIDNTSDQQKDHDDLFKLLKDIKVDKDSIPYDATIDSKYQIKLWNDSMTIHFNHDCSLIWITYYDPIENTSYSTEMDKVINQSDMIYYFQQTPGQVIGSTFYSKGQSFLDGLVIESFSLDKVENFIHIHWLNTSEHTIYLPYDYDILRKYQDTYRSIKEPSASLTNNEILKIKPHERVSSMIDISCYDFASQGDYQFVIKQDDEIIGYYQFYDYDQ